MPKLYPYQEQGVAWLTPRRRAYLADAPGLGKTPQEVVAIVRAGHERPAVICPASARSVWQRAFDVWAPALFPRLITSYDWLVRHPETTDKLPEWCDHLVIDEVHYAAHTGARRTRLAMRLANRFPSVHVLSGTPLRNRPFDLYPVLRAIWPDLLREVGVLRAHQFRALFEWEIITPGGRSIVKAKNVPLLRSILDKIMLRRRIEDVGVQLPPLRWEATALELPSEVRQEMQYALAQVADYEEIIAALERGEIPGDSHGSVSTVRRILGTAKAYPAAELLAAELESGLLEKVVVIAYHRDVLDVIERTLQPYTCVRVDGASSSNARAAAVDRFQDDPHCRVFLGQIKSAGECITLTAAHEIVLVEQSWVPDENVQAVKRIHRLGQGAACRARELVVSDSIDEAVTRVRRRKMELIGEILLN